MKDQLNKDKKNELISIIIPCFNSGSTLPRTLNSIINQTWKNKEIIIVNDGSTDKETLLLINKFREIPGIIVINQTNLGLPAARNAGAYASHGEYLFFIDSDDWVELDSLELLFEFLKVNEDAAFVYSDIILEGKVRKVIKKEYNFFEQLFLNQLPYSIFIPKKKWIYFGGYDENMRLGYEDWEFNIRLGANKNYGKRLSKPLFHYNVSNSGMLISKSSKYHAQIVNYIIAKNPDLYNFKKIFYFWLNWRNNLSTYPLIIFFPWFILIRTIPKPLMSNLFILLRNLKWFFSRNEISFSKFILNLRSK